jgi:recombination protein RecR
MQRLIHELTKLPSVGEKSAIRLAYHLLMKTPAASFALADAIREARERTSLCSRCFALSEADVCHICEAPQRDSALLCVVEKPSDVLSIEKSGGYRGLYHVLHGLWSPLRGVGPEQTKLPELLKRLGASSRANGNGSANGGSAPCISEVIIATGTTVEGDATALYIAQALEKLDIRVTRIAQGIPKGGDLEYADELTLTHAIQGRRALG